MWRRGRAMRTTLDLDEDILNAAKVLAAQERKPVGQFVSEVLRVALPVRGGATNAMRARERYGFKADPGRRGGGDQRSRQQDSR